MGKTGPDNGTSRHLNNFGNTWKVFSSSNNNSQQTVTCQYAVLSSYCCSIADSWLKMFKK